MNPDPGGDEAGGGVGVGDVGKKQEKDNNGKEKSTKQFSVSFFLKTEELPPLLFLFSPTWLDQSGADVKRNKHEHDDKNRHHLFVRT